MWEGTGLGNPTIFWTLRLILLAVLIICGAGISYGKKEYFNRYAFVAGAFYSLIEGLRWMRGADYYHYYNDLVTLFGTHPGLYGRGTVTPDPEPIYNLFVNFTFYTGIPFWVTFIFYSALLISGILMIVKVYPKIAVWALPFFFVVTVDAAENIIRQYFAVCFIVFAYCAYLRDKKIVMLLMMVIAPLIHYSTIVMDAGLLWFVFTSKPLGKYYDSNLTLAILSIIFVYMFWFFDLSSMTAVADFINAHSDSMDDENKASMYLQNADRWVTEEGSISMVVHGKAAATIGLIAKSVNFLSFLILIVLGFIAKKGDSKLIMAYYITYIGLILKSMGGDIEMFARFYNLCVVFMPVVFGIIFTRIKMNSLVKTVVLTPFILHYLWYTFLSSMLGTSLFGYAFIWDANVDLF